MDGAPVKNYPLMRKVLETIELYPEHHDQSWWVTCGDEGTFGEAYEQLRAGRLDLECGTTLCIAGWALHLSNSTVSPSRGISETAGELLGLTYDEEQDLFSAHQSNAEARNLLREYIATEADAND